MRRLPLVLLLLLPVLAAACGGGGGSKSLVWGIADEPVGLDGALAPDAESRRVASQIFEGLVGLTPGTTDVVPGLAESWESNAEGTAWTFHLRSGVMFQDATQLDAEAVCFNFERWHGFPSELRSQRATYYWQRVFGGFEGEEGLYAGCKADDLSTVVLELTRPSAAFLAALAMPAFGIASPTALRAYDADSGTVDPQDGFEPTGTFATEHPVGTGPFQLESWARDSELVLVRNEDYWGAKPELERVAFKVIPDDRERLAALQRGEIQGYDFVPSQDIPAVEGDENLRLLDRPAFDVGYLTINAARGPFRDVRARKALAYALDRERYAATFSGSRAVVAEEFVPPELFGYASDVERYRLDPAKAKALLRQAGLELPVPVEFWYPTGVSRPYLPDGKAAFDVLSSDLKRAGFVVTGKSADWSKDYLVRVDEGRAGDISLIGWTGDYADPQNFVGTFFGRPSRQFGLDDERLVDLLSQAEREPSRPRREQLYQAANRRIMEFLPGVPLVHTKQAIALSADIEGYISSPVLVEPFAIVSIK